MPMTLHPIRRLPATNLQLVLGFFFLSPALERRRDHDTEEEGQPGRDELLDDGSDVEPNRCRHDREDHDGSDD